MSILGDARRLELAPGKIIGLVYSRVEGYMVASARRGRDDRPGQDWLNANPVIGEEYIVGIWRGRIGTPRSPQPGPPHHHHTQCLSRAPLSAASRARQQLLRQPRVGRTVPATMTTTTITRRIPLSTLQKVRALELEALKSRNSHSYRVQLSWMDLHHCRYSRRCCFLQVRAVAGLG